MEYAYATCILNESGEEINETNLTAVLEAAGCDVQESRVKALVAALEDIEIDSAVDFDDLGSEPAHNGASTAEAPSDPSESDLTDASGMDLVSAETDEGLDESSTTNGAVEAEADSTEPTPDDSGATNGAVEAEADSTEPTPDDSGATNGEVEAGADGTQADPDDDAAGLDELFGEEASRVARDPDGSSDAVVDRDPVTGSDGADTESDEV